LPYESAWHAPTGFSLQKVREVLSSSSEQAERVLQEFATALVKAATSVQYDCAVESGRQLGCELPKEPFTSLQQRQTKFDGGREEDDTIRPLVQLADKELPGHILREQATASSEARAVRGSWQHVPLTGCEQSQLPLCRLSSQAFISKVKLHHLETNFIIACLALKRLKLELSLLFQ
jgi:hypothetical protein